MKPKQQNQNRDLGICKQISVFDWCCLSPRWLTTLRLVSDLWAWLRAESIERHIPSEIINRVPAGADKRLRRQQRSVTVLQWNRNPSSYSHNPPILFRPTLSHCIAQTHHVAQLRRERNVSKARTNRQTLPSRENYHRARTNTPHDLWNRLWQPWKQQADFKEIKFKKSKKLILKMFHWHLTFDGWIEKQRTIFFSKHYFQICFLTKLISGIKKSFS